MISTGKSTDRFNFNTRGADKMAVKGAGGTNGGIGRFFMGLTMMIAGGYLFFNAIRVTNHFHMGYSIYSFGSYHLTSGMVLVPLIFGIGLIFFNSRNFIGWFLSGASLIMIVFGIISSIDFRLRHMSAFELIVMLVLMVGGLGLFLSSLRNHHNTYPLEHRR
jgi:hypothetical protein